MIETETLKLEAEKLLASVNYRLDSLYEDEIATEKDEYWSPSTEYLKDFKSDLERFIG